MANVWAQLVVHSADKANIVQLGKNAYARKKSEMYSNMKSHAINLLVEEGYGYLLDDSQPLYKNLDAIRALPENIMDYKVDGVSVDNERM